MALPAGTDGWSALHLRIDALRLPQRPDAGVAARLAAQIEGHEERVLQLGVTRELAPLGRRQTTVDSNREQIDRLWRGSRPGQSVRLADWRTMDFPEETFTAAIGDGSFSSLTWREGYTQVLGRVAHALAPRGRLAVRCYVAPDVPETLDTVAEDVLSGREPSFHATRWRVAMAAARDGNVRVSGIFEAFERTFPDREALCLATGWAPETVALIDPFRNSPLTYSFPTRAMLIEALDGRFAEPRFVSSGEYPLSDRCPFLVAERAD